MNNQSKSIISCSIGNILEWYDYGLFAIYSSLFSHLFFPTATPSIALITTLSIFAVGFLCRPLGALIFGYLGDSRGRAKTLRLSILMIALPTLLIGCLPTYQTIGIWAPILLMLTRIWQGMSIGGEYSGNLIYLAEIAPIKFRATITSLGGMGANLGILLAMFLGGMSSYFMSHPAFMDWGWRIPYLLSGLLCLIVYAIRLSMEETEVFIQLKNKKLLAHNPIRVVFKTNVPQMLRTLGLVCMGSTFYYFCFIYMPIFLTNDLQFSLFKTSNVMSFFIASMVLLVPLAGRLCDHVGRRKMLLFNAALISVIIVPGFYLLNETYLLTTLLVLTVFTLASSLEQAATSVAVVENFPLPARYTGLSLSYNIGNGVFGGTVPVISAWLIAKTHWMLSPAFYIAACAIVTLLVTFFFVRDTQKKHLTEMCGND